MDWCRCCEERGAAWALTAQPLRRYRGWRPSAGGRTPSVAVCEGCARWLAELVIASREEPGALLFGQPGANGRHLVFEDQCGVCCDSPAERAFAVRWERSADSAGELFACVACTRWLLGLAGSGRTLRGAGERFLDGRYGMWPHPRLRGLRVWWTGRDRGAAEVAAATAAALGLAQAESPQEADAVLVEATRSGGARELCLRLGSEAWKVTVLAGPGLRADVAGALEAGAQGWTTLPATPQQVTAALARTARGRREGAWEPTTCLPLLDVEIGERPWLFVPVDRAGDAWELAWLVRRFSRGYDTVGAVPGGIGVVPVVAPGAVERVAERLREALGLEAAVEVRRGEGRWARRFEAAG